MAKPLKPFVRGGYYPSSRWTPLVYPGGYTTANGAMPLINTVKGAIAHVTDALAMPAIGLKCEINPLQAGTGDPSPTNVRPITGWTGCKLHRTGVSLIGGDAFIGNTFSKTATGYELSYNGSSIPNRASASADVSGIPAGRYTIAMLNLSYPAGASVNIRRRTDGSIVTMGFIINAESATGRRTYDIPENTTALQLYIIPDSMPLNTSITMSDIVLVREGDDPESYKGNVYNITFPSEVGTAYGGTLDVTNGTLMVTEANIASYDGETLPGEWISDRDVYSAGATPTTGAQVVYKLSNPIAYQLTPQQIELFAGTNNIWHNANGDTELTYYAE